MAVLRGRGRMRAGLVLADSVALRVLPQILNQAQNGNGLVVAVLGYFPATSETNDAPNR